MKLKCSIQSLENCLVFGTDFNWTVSTAAFMSFVTKIPPTCMFERTIPHVAFKNGLRHKRERIVTSTQKA